MKTIIKKRINDNIFKRSLNIAFCEDTDENIDKLAKWMGIEASILAEQIYGLEAVTLGLTDKKDGSIHSFIWCKRFDVKLIVHELCHFTHISLDTVGVSRNEDETFAYFLEYYLSEILKLNK